MGTLEMIASMLPENDIVISPTIGIDYSGLNGAEPVIANGRIYGYFDGTIQGISAADQIKNATFA